jgi:hypothetical protein
VEVKVKGTDGNLMPGGGIHLGRGSGRLKCRNMPEIIDSGPNTNLEV